MKKVAVLPVLVLLATAAVAQSSLSLPVGTPVRMKLQITLATFTSRVGQPFFGTVTQPVMQGGQVVIPIGSEIKGRVTKMSEPRRIAGKPTIGLRPETVTLPNGQQFALSAVLVDTSLRDGSDVNEEGQFKGPGHDRHDTRETLVVAGGGVLIGALAGGANGGVIGGGIGAGATVVHWFIKRRSATLPAGTELVMEVSRPIVVTPMMATVSAGGGR